MDIDCRGDRICDAGVCISPDDSNSGAGSFSGGGSTSGSGGFSGSGNTGGGSNNIDARGFWLSMVNLGDDTDPFHYMIVWTLCPNGNMSGTTVFGVFDFNAEKWETLFLAFAEQGTYTSDASTVSVDYVATDLSDGEEAEVSVTLTYDSSEDALLFPNDLPLFRVETKVTNADCQSPAP